MRQALEPLKKAETILRQNAENEPDNVDTKFRLAVVLHEIGYSYWEHKEVSTGEPILREAIKLLNYLLERDAGNFQYAVYLGMCQTRLAASMTEWTEERGRLYELAYKSLKHLTQLRPDNNAAMVAFSRVAVNRAFRAASLAKYSEAEALYQEARMMLIRSIQADPNAAITFVNYHYSVMGLADVYAKTNRLAKAVDSLKQAIDEMAKKAHANPAITAFQRALALLHGDLHKLHLQQKQREKAIESLQEAIRISDSLATRLPQQAQYAIDITYYTTTLSDLLKGLGQQNEAILLYDKLIRQGNALLKLHPKTSTLLQNLIYACRQRGEMLFEAGQHAAARVSFQDGVNLHDRYSRGIDQPSEALLHNYFECCRGLFRVAMIMKDTKIAIEIAKSLILPLDIEQFKLGDNKQGLIGEWISLSSLYEDTGDVTEALKLKVRAVAASKKMLNGDPKSNWYAYQQVFGSHHHLARLYRMTGNEAKEFEELRGYFQETQPYVDGTDHTALLKQTVEFSSVNLKRLREEKEKVFNSGRMKRFTVPIDFGGVNYPIHVYVAETWQFTEDQFTWVEKVRGGKVPKEVRDSFQRLYKIAKDNKVSFQDICVYALGTAAAKGPTLEDTPIASAGGLQAQDLDTNKAVKELSVARAELEAQPKDPSVRKRFILKFIKLAEANISSANYFRAGFLLEDARSAISLNSLGQLKDPSDRDVYAYYLYVYGASLAGRGDLMKGYTTLLESRKNAPPKIDPEIAFPSGSLEYALGWTSSKLQRPIESITWYRRAFELGYGPGAQRLFDLISTHSDALKLLPEEWSTAYFEAKKLHSKDDPAPVVLARLMRANQDKAEKLANLARSRKALLEALRVAESDPDSLIFKGLLCSCYTSVGDGLMATSQFNDSIYYFSKTLVIREQMNKANPKSDLLLRATFQSHNKLGLAASKLNRHQDALLHFQNGLGIVEPLLERSPKNSDLQGDVFIIIYNIGYANEQLAEYKEAIKWYERAVASFGKLDKPAEFASDLARIKKRLADCKLKSEKSKAKSSPVSGKGTSPNFM